MRLFGTIAGFMVLPFALALAACAQDTPPVEQPQPAAPTTQTPDTFFEHSQTAKWWVSGQANFIFQANGSFYAQYSGPNSFKNVPENALSRVLTLFTAYEFTPQSQLYLDVEETGGSGLSSALGLAGFVNLDVVRNPSIGQQPYIARLFFQQSIPLSDEKEESDRTSLSMPTEVPVKRLNLRFGKFALADFFDNNIGGTDSHYQFLNWVIDNNGAYDYAADTRGYTIGAMIELEERNWALRFAETLMPKVANGPNLDADVARARSENVELELRPQLLKKKETTIRLLNYVNHADMGDYEQAVKLYLDGVTPTPDVTATRQQGTVKYGFGANFEQELWKDSYAFGRWGWNEGEHESFCYTEDNEGYELGIYSRGTNWHRSLDRAGAAFVSSGLSKAHQAYLAYGGLGFLLGDGALNYGRENIEEVFYTAHVWRGLFLAGDVQHINNPGMNRDRGPFTVPGIRLHLEF
ncbi:MAG TPA: carbohydrate porin [Terriglobales bacterium]